MIRETDISWDEWDWDDEEVFDFFDELDYVGTVSDPAPSDFIPLLLFRFLDKREHNPDEIFRVHDVGLWVNCRRPGLRDGGEYRYSFSEEYMKGSTIEKMGKGVEPTPPPVYTRPRKILPIWMRKKSKFRVK